MPSVGKTIAGQMRGVRGRVVVHAVDEKGRYRRIPLSYRNARVRELPIASLLRPMEGTRSNDPEKVEWLMRSIAEEGQKVHLYLPRCSPTLTGVPIDVLDVDGKYYSFSGCHRYEACTRLGMETIKCRIIPANETVLQQHLK